MWDFVTTPFRGSLLELFGELESFMPARDALIRGHEWIVKQPRHSPNLLPYRTCAGHRDRGERHRIDDLEFCPVDNELLAELYQHLLSERELPSSIVEALRFRLVPLSWHAVESSGFRVGPATTGFRKYGILLAHLFDAASGISGTDAAAFLLRFRRSLDPINVMPWPGHRRTRQRVTSWSSALDTGIPTRADLSGDPTLQAIMRGFAASRLGGLDAPCVRHWLDGCQGTVTEVMRGWAEHAAKIAVEIEPRKGAQAPKHEQGEGPQQLCEPGTSFQSFDELVAQFREWIDWTTAVQVDGSLVKKPNPKPWAYFPVRFPSDEFMQVPIRNRHNVRVAVESRKLSEFSGTYRIHGDTKKTAIVALLDRIDAVVGSDDLLDIFEPTLTEAGTQKMNMSGAGGANGLYCYWCSS